MTLQKNNITNSLPIKGSRKDMGNVGERLFVCWLLNVPATSVSQGRICSDNFTYCHTEIEVADPTFYLTQSQYTDTGPTSPSADPIMPGTWQDSHWSANFWSHWYDSTLKKSKCKRDLNPGSSALKAVALPLGQRGGLGERREWFLVLFSMSVAEAHTQGCKQTGIYKHEIFFLPILKPWKYCVFSVKHRVKPEIYHLWPSHSLLIAKSHSDKETKVREHATLSLSMLENTQRKYLCVRKGHKSICAVLEFWHMQDVCLLVA